MDVARSFHFLTAALAAVALSACSGGAGGSSYAPGAGAAGPTSAQGQSVSQEGIVDAASPQIFISDAADNAVDVYSAKGKLLYQRTGFSEPQGLATDSTGSLFVADTGNSQIVVFANPHGGTPVMLSDSGQYPAGVAVAAGTGLVAATNIISTTGGAGSVSFYKKGQTAPCATVSNATAFQEIYFGAFDAEGDLFIDGLDKSGNPAIGEVHGGCSATTIETLSYKGVSLGFPGGVGVNVKDQIVVAGTSALYTFAKPVHGSLGNPLKVTKLSGQGAGTFAFTGNGKDLWTLASGTGGATEYAYPAGGLPVASFQAGGAPVGIAVTPAEKP